MAPQYNPGPEFYAYDRREAKRAEASQAWAGTLRLFLLLAAVAGFVWVLWFAFGITGLQFGLIAAFVIGVVLGVWQLILATHDRVSDTHAEAVSNIVRFQGEDDYGETLRALVTAVASSQRGGQQLDGRLLQLANLIGSAKAKGEIAAIEAKQTIDAYRQQTAQVQQQGEQQQRSAFYSFASGQPGADPNGQARPANRNGPGFNIYE